MSEIKRLLKRYEGTVHCYDYPDLAEEIEKEIIQHVQELEEALQGCIDCWPYDNCTLGEDKAYNKAVKVLKGDS